MSIINDFKNEFRFSAHGRTSRRNFWIYQIGLFVLGLAVAMVCGTIIGLTNAVVGFWLIIAALLILLCPASYGVLSNSFFDARGHRSRMMLKSHKSVMKITKSCRKV